MRCLIVMIFLVALCFAQQIKAQGILNLYEAPGIREMVNRDIGINKGRKEVTGWSVMLLVTNDRQKADQMKINFLATHPDIKADWDFETPYYRLKAGAFLSKVEATLLLNDLREQYPDAYVIKNFKIAPRDILTGSSILRY